MLFRSPPGTFGLVRIASALAAELMGRGKKKEREKMGHGFHPPSPGLFATPSCFVLGPWTLLIIPEDSAQEILRHVSPAPRSPYATIMSGGKRPVAPGSLYLRLSNGRQHNIPRTLSSAMDGKLLTGCDRDVTFSEKGNINS